MTTQYQRDESARKLTRIVECVNEARRLLARPKISLARIAILCDQLNQAHIAAERLHGIVSAATQEPQ